MWQRVTQPGKTVLFDKKTLSKKAVVEISAFSFETLIDCY